MWPPSRAAMPEPIDWRSAGLRAIRDLSPDIRLFEIEPTGQFVAPTPGSHFNITVHINGRPDLRNYSAVGHCADGLYRIAVKRLPGSRGGSTYMWSLVPGDQVTISTPATISSSALVAQNISCSPAGLASRRCTPWRWPWPSLTRISGWSMQPDVGKTSPWRANCGTGLVD